MRLGFLWGPGRQRASPEGFLKGQLSAEPWRTAVFQEGCAA